MLKKIITNLLGIVMVLSIWLIGALFVTMVETGFCAIDLIGIIVALILAIFCGKRFFELADTSIVEEEETEE